MKIRLLISNREEIEIEVEKNDTIRKLVEKIKQKIDIPINFLTISGLDVSKSEYDNKTIEDFDLDDGDNILISDLYNGGFLGIDMADISNKNGLIRKNFASQAPKWNTIRKGLNISGICKNNSCEAYDQEVDCKIGMGKFDLVGDADEIKCPICFNEINPTTCVFCECKYKFEGKKKINGKTEKVSSDWNRVEKDYEYFDPGKSGIVTWLRLIIETKPLD